MADTNEATHRYENPALSYNPLLRLWYVSGPAGASRTFDIADWNMHVVFERKPLKVGDSVMMRNGIHGEIIAIHEGTSSAWVVSGNLKPFTKPLADLSHV